VALLGVAMCVAASYAVASDAAGRTFAQISQQADRARETNDLDRAVKLYRQALVMRPRWAEGWWSLGTIYYDRNAYGDAARAFQRLVTIEPKHGTGHAMLGLCQFELGQDDNALANLEGGRRLGILKNDDLRRVVLYHQGVLYLRKSKFSSAQEALMRLARDGVREDVGALALGMSVLLVHPDKLPPDGSIGHDIVIRAGQAEMAGARNEPEEARRLYDLALQQAADFPNLHYAYGRFLLGIREPDAALTQFEQEIANNPRHVQAHLEIAAVRYRIDSADGVKHAEEAVALDSKLPFGHYLLGLLYLDTGQFPKAVSELEVALEAFPTQPEVYFALGNAYAKAGRKEDAARARAAFVRLNAKVKPHSGPTTYGAQQTLGLDQQRLDSAPETEPKD
jgi:tetratricopeptide (TPR) repeat protein